MNKNVLIGAAVVIALFLSLPLLANLKKPAGGGYAGGGASSEMTTESASVTPASGGAPSWNAGNLPGTVWSIKGYTVTMGAGGQASMAGTPVGTVNGTWAVNGSKLTLSAMGRTIDAQISGDQILVNGEAAQRVQ